MISSERLKHFITTPFYVRRVLKGHSEAQLASVEWLDHRVRLFESYCLPSVIGQSESNFQWLIYFDEATPSKHLEHVSSLIANHARIAMKLCRVWEPSVIARDVNAGIGDSTDWIITTRLDNDDGLHRDFVARVQSAFQEREEFLNFPHGIIFYSGKFFLYRHLSNAFLSYVERPDRLRTVWCVAHENAGQIAPVRQLSNAPGFLQVVHDRNLSNKPRGTRLESGAALTGFESIPALKPSANGESRLTIWLENATTVMVWKLRDFLISLGKGAVRR